jgi:phosphoenolpyruvate-protein kinase (PTS system EI component)
MPKDNSSFQDLEKQLAKDSLKKALKDLHGEITKDVEKNKATFSQEIQKTLKTFKEDLEDTISKELDQRISAHLKMNFLDISTKVTSSFYESSSPFLQQAEEDLQRLHRQGESTLTSWKAMMLQYTSL